VETVEEHLRKVVATNQRDWNERLHIFLLAYRALTKTTTGMTSANMVFGRELHLSCDLFFSTPADKEQSTTNYTADLVEQLHGIHHYAHHHLKVASDQMKACNYRLTNFAGFQKGKQV
jgi:hypothetical protein